MSQIPFAVAVSGMSAALVFALWLLHTARSALKVQRADNVALQASRQIDLFRMARRDPLTGLANRQAFMETLAALSARGASFAVLLADIDRFDTINANLGDGCGDEVLLCIAGRLQAMCKERDHVARLDGDLFGLLLTQASAIEDVPAAVSGVSVALSLPSAAAGQLIDAGVSIGVALAPQHGLNAETLLRAAQSALRQARENGGGRWHVCGQVQAAEVLERQGVRRDLQRAIEAGQIVPYYQPIVRLPGGEIATFEVLARWNHPKLGLLSPDQFIPMADEMGLGGQISMSLLRQVAADTQNWPAWCRTAINVSPGQVRELIGLLNTQPGAWQRRMDLSRLDVEISEAALLQDHGLARELIDVLHEQGARAVLDDFGSGSSNFFHLRDMPFDSVKIGKSFVTTLMEDPRAEACVMAMVWLGKGLGLDVVADGVETPEIAERLTELGCHYAQGFLYARPGTAKDACRLLDIEEDVPAKEAA